MTTLSGPAGTESTISVPKRSSMQQSFSRVCGQWPLLWPEWKKRRFRPVAIGTAQQMHDWLKAHPESPVTHDDIVRVMRSATRHTTYLEQMLCGAPRYSLEGIPAGIVTEKDEAWSRQLLEEVKAFLARRNGENRTEAPGTV